MLKDSYVYSREVHIFEIFVCTLAALACFFLDLIENTQGMD